MGYHHKARHGVRVAGAGVLVALALAACGTPQGSSGVPAGSPTTAVAIPTSVASAASTAVSTADAQRMLSLLDTIEKDYGAAVSGSTVNAQEYAEAREAFRSFRQSYQGVSSVVEAASSGAAKEIDNELQELDKVFAEEHPTKAPAPAEDVAHVVGEIRAALSSALGLGAAAQQTPQTPEARVSSIKSMVDQAVTEYRAGKNEAAYELAANAYLQGFEHLEPDLEAKGQTQLMTDVEGRFKELRDAIKAGKPVSEVEAVAQRVQQGLDQTLGALR